MFDNTKVVLDLTQPVKTISINNFAGTGFNVDNLQVDSSVENTSFFASSSAILSSPAYDLRYSVLENLKTIEISPLGFYSSSFENVGFKIRVLCPYNINKNSVCLNFTKDSLQLNFVVENGYLVTVDLSERWLISDELIPQNPVEGGQFINIQQIRNVDLCDLVVLRAFNYGLIGSFNDGSLVKFHGKGGNFEASKLHESIGSGVFPELGKLLGFSNDKVPGHPNFSVKTVISMDVISEELLATYSVNGDIKLWSLLTLNCLSVVKPNEPPILRLTPSNYIGHTIDCVYVACDTGIRVFRLQTGTQSSAQTQNQLELVVFRPYPKDTQEWFVNDVCCKNGIVLVSMKNNLNYKSFILQVDGTWDLIESYKPTDLLDISVDTSLSSVIDRISSFRLEVVIACLQSMLQGTPTPGNTCSLDLLGGNVNDLSIDSVIEYAGKNFVDMKQWIRLETLCQELNQRGSDLLYTCVIDQVDGLLYWTVHSSHIALHAVNEVNKLGSDINLDDCMAKLFRDVTPNEWNIIGNAYTKTALALDVVNYVCEILKVRVDQSLLTFMGREQGMKIVDGMIAFVNQTKPLFNTLKSSKLLNGIGRELTASVLKQHCIHMAEKYRKFCTLIIISIVEGWDPERSESDLLRLCTENYRLFNLFANVPTSCVSKEVVNVDLKSLGPSLLQSLVGDVSYFKVLSNLIPLAPNTFTTLGYKNFMSLTERIDQSAQVKFLRGIASFSARDDEYGEKLLREVSISQPWFSFIESQPTSQATWLYRASKVAESYGAIKAALSLGKSALHLISKSDEELTSLLNSMFGWCLSCNEVELAYNVLSKLHTQHPEDRESLKLKINQLLERAACVDTSLVFTMVSSYPFFGMSDLVVDELANSPSFGAVPAYKLLYTWFIEHEDFVSAAKVVYDYVDGNKELEKSKVRELLTVCLNALVLVDSDSRWICTAKGVATYSDIELQKTRIQNELQLS